MMKSTLYIIFCCCIISLAACDDEAITLNPNVTASAAYIHAAPGPTSASPLDIVVDGLVSNGSRRLTYGLVSAGGGTGNGGAYMPLLVGTRNIKISPDSGKISLIDVTVPFEKNSAYTIIAYDTLSPARNTLLAVRLNDNLTVPATGKVHVRFINASPNGRPYDVSMVRSLSGVPVDSVTITNKAYLGTSPDVNAVSIFTPVPISLIATPPATTAYDLKIKLAGTQTVVFSTSLGTNFSGTGRIFTITSIGTAAGRALGIVLLRHF